LTNIGYNPTFKNKVLSIETHILDFSADIVSQNIKVNFLARLRDEIRFGTAEELSQQITRDIEGAHKFFRERGN
jgi:riboflavin kinase/FMN adenylyltransferase